MRKLLLAGVAALCSFAAAISAVGAQSLVPSVFEGVQSSPLPVQAANNANNASVLAAPNGVANPAPGSIVVHLNGRVVFYGVGAFTSLDRTAGVGRGNVGAAKLAPFTALGFVRLDPGFAPISRSTDLACCVWVRATVRSASSTTASPRSRTSIPGMG